MQICCGALDISKSILLTDLFPFIRCSSEANYQILFSIYLRSIQESLGTNKWRARKQHNDLCWDKDTELHIYRTVAMNYYKKIDSKLCIPFIEKLLDVYCSLFENAINCHSSLTGKNTRIGVASNLFLQIIYALKFASKLHCNPSPSPGRSWLVTCSRITACNFCNDSKKVDNRAALTRCFTGIMRPVR